MMHSYRFYPGSCLLVLLLIVALLVPWNPPDSTGQVLNNGLARTPPMGFNDWTASGCNVSATLIEETADAMVTNSMLAAGYQYVTMDDCWMAHARDANGNLLANAAAFPHGIKAVADHLHAEGLKLGIYEDAGTATCAGLPGSYNH